MSGSGQTVEGAWRVPVAAPSTGESEGPTRAVLVPAAGSTG
ncbi:hypothetical protein ACFO5R_11450 [Halosolutus amylolyticus]|uniref:Uncharacterized protein n=1 Tax=Halosolutus amylolyticus TaxID=2932267 RepID=A0ABD5PQ02_9EURY|nr:hypothetical protein [Halosolutus amylolyticus]